MMEPLREDLPRTKGGVTIEAILRFRVDDTTLFKPVYSSMGKAGNAKEKTTSY